VCCSRVLHLVLLCLRLRCLKGPIKAAGGAPSLSPELSHCVRRTQGQKATDTQGLYPGTARCLPLPCLLPPCTLYLMLSLSAHHSSHQCRVIKPRMVRDAVAIVDPLPFDRAALAEVRGGFLSRLCRGPKPSHLGPALGHQANDCHGTSTITGPGRAAQRGPLLRAKKRVPH